MCYERFQLLRKSQQVITNLKMMKQQRVKNKHKSDKENLTLVIYHLCSLPRSRFLDVTQRERCVTSKNRLLGRLSHVKIDVCSEDDLQTARTCWMIQAHIQTNRLTVPDVVELFMNFNSLSLVHLVKSSTFGLGLTGKQCYFPFTSQNHPGGN